MFQTSKHSLEDKDSMDADSSKKSNQQLRIPPRLPPQQPRGRSQPPGLRQHPTSTPRMDFSHSDDQGYKYR